MDCSFSILFQSSGDYDLEVHSELKNLPDPSEISIRRDFRKPRISIRTKIVSRYFIKEFIGIIRVKVLRLLIRNFILLIRGKTLVFRITEVGRYLI